MTTCALVHAVTQIWTLIMHLASRYEASVTIESDDPIYMHVMAWLTAHVSTRKLQARTSKSEEFSIDDPASMEEYASATKNGVFNLSTLPVQEFLQETKRLYLDQEGSKIPIFKAIYGIWGSRWKCAIVRHARHIDNISLDKSVITPILNDVKEFLKPTAAKWYANRGIPYRRGYLFHGPPGTGKTSFTLALAGTFGLPIYNLSLGDPTITEERLLQYFAELPRRCILLIEDIDTVAISKKRDGADVSQGNHNKNNPNNNISLSGLLNAIDGVISHEGRILVMTTNHPEHLDPALTRHGRVDLKIHFGLATREQIASLFVNMYSHDHDDSDVEYEYEGEEDFFREKITAAAETFSGFLPAGKFSPAEIQGFLTLRKHSYMTAVMEAEQWGRDTLAMREVSE
ncbi:Paraplegin [Arthrobotrys entomopaga]|nr:Paraplegin [Arthrobotrys entomopaga]